MCSWMEVKIGKLELIVRWVKQFIEFKYLNELSSDSDADPIKVIQNFDLHIVSSLIWTEIFFVIKANS